MVQQVFSWSSWNIFVSIKRYRNAHFAVQEALGQEISRGGILLQWLIFRKKTKETSTQGWLGRPWMLGKGRGRSCSALPPAPLGCCHPHCATSRSLLLLYPCHPPALLQVTQGEGSWSVTPTCSTSINLLVKHQGSFTSVMTFYFITQHAVHEAAFPQRINLVREKTPFSPLLCHQCLSEIREHFWKCFHCLNSEWLENRLKVPLCTVALYESVFCLTGLNKKKSFNLCHCG